MISIKKCMLFTPSFIITSYTLSLMQDPPGELAVLLLR
jgi:hypothetical protein